MRKGIHLVIYLMSYHSCFLSWIWRSNGTWIFYQFGYLLIHGKCGFSHLLMFCYFPIAKNLSSKTSSVISVDFIWNRYLPLASFSLLCQVQIKFSHIWLKVSSSCWLLMFINLFSFTQSHLSNVSSRKRNNRSSFGIGYQVEMLTVEEIWRC